MKSSSLLIFSILLILTWNAAALWKATEVPDPLINFGGCGRPRSSYVCNPDYLLTDETADEIDDMIQSLGDYTMECADNYGTGYYRFAVAVMKSGIYYDSPYRDVQIASYAEELRLSWKIGDPICGNGLLLLIMSTDRLVYVSRGVAAASVVTDEKLDEIFDSDFLGLLLRLEDGATEDIVKQIVDLLNVQSKAYRTKRLIHWSMFFGFVVLLVASLFMCIMMCGRPRRKAVEKISQLQKARSEAQISKQMLQLRAGDASQIRTRWPPSMCSLCLKDFKLRENVRDPNVAVTLPCGHIFHKRKCAKWYLDGRDSCPICDTSFQEDDLPLLVSPYRPAHEIYDRAFLDYHVRDFKERFSGVAGVQNFSRRYALFTEDADWVVEFRYSENNSIFSLDA